MAKLVLSNLDFGNAAKVVNLPDPSAAQDAATKAYVDAAIEGTAWKDNVRVATQSNISIASPGATIDGVTMATNDRFLARSQTSQPENGIYIWNGAAVPATRSPDASTAIELEQAVVGVDEGTSAGATFRQTTVNFTLGSGNVVWQTFGTSAPSASETTAGIAELATQAETDTGSDDTRIVTPMKLATWSGRPRKHAQTFGDGSATQYDITHNFNTTDVQVEVSVVATGASVLCDVARNTVNVVRLNFAVAPATNTLRVTVHG